MTNISSADFATVRQSLQTFLSNQTQFNSYNFDGSAMSVLLDILAYNTTYLASYGNMVFSESFLDTAAQMSSVTSRAKELGYLPRSMQAAKANINLSFSVAGNPSQYILPKNTVFAATVDSTTYNFVTTEDITFTNVANVFSQTIEVAQGVLTSYQYVVDLTNTAQRLIIPSTAVDTDFLTVSFMDSISDIAFIPVPYVDAFSLGAIDGTTLLYLLQLSFDGFYEVFFGDGTIGQAVASGNVVQLNYLITNGDSANAAQNFTLSSTLSGVTSMTITTIDAATGGSQAETVDSIKFLAPLFFESQDRAVTTNDYIVLLKNNYGNVSDVSVWGGEQNNPPYYGKVFIAIAPTGGGTLSQTNKDAITNDIISKYNIVSIRPQIVDPNYIYVSVNTNVTYNAKLYTSLTNADLQSQVTTSITNFFATQGNKFGNTIYYSKLCAAIDLTAPIILDSITNLTLQRVTPILPGTATEYTFNFNNAISPNSVVSNQFVIDGVTYNLKDLPDGNLLATGKLQVYTVSGNNVTYLFTNAGTINYNTGTLTLPNIRIDSILTDPINQLLAISVGQGDFLDIANPNIVTSDKNIYCNGREDIVVLQQGGINVNLIAANI